MGRPRGFDEDAALEAAMQVFWAKSYEGTTIADLTEAMGINRSSMYAAFGDKESIFRRVMERYRAGRMTYIRQALAQPSLREVVAGLIHGTAEFLSSPDNPRGCLLIQGALACGTDAERVKLTMIDWRKSGEAALKKRLQQARSEGELPAEIQPADFARYYPRSWQALAFRPPTGQRGQSCGASLDSPCAALKPCFGVLEAGNSAARSARIGMRALMSTTPLSEVGSFHSHEPSSDYLGLMFWEIALARC